MSEPVVRPFTRADRDQLTSLVNAHVTAVVPGWAVSTAALLGQLERDAGQYVTDVRDRDYFKAIYFRTPQGILFEIATTSPGFAVDEDPVHLGEALRLPSQHEHLREHLERELGRDAKLPSELREGGLDLGGVGRQPVRAGRHRRSVRVQTVADDGRWRWTSASSTWS